MEFISLVSKVLICSNYRKRLVIESWFRSVKLFSSFAPLIKHPAADSPDAIPIKNMVLAFSTVKFYDSTSISDWQLREMSCACVSNANIDYRALLFFANRKSLEIKSRTH